MPSDFRILGPQVKNGEEGRGMEGRRGRGREKGKNGEKRGLHTLTTFLTFESSVHRFNGFRSAGGDLASDC